MTRKAFTYGTISARIKMQGEQGAWPAFWTLGADYQRVGWPACGEIDVMESVDDTIFAGVHGPLSSRKPSAKFSLGGHLVLDPFSVAQWHTYSATWTARAIVFRIDGHVWATAERSELRPGQQWVTGPQRLILNIAVGAWAGPPALGDFHASMLIDWVRVTSP